MYVLNVYQYVKPGKTQEYLAKLRENEICEIAEKEPGCHMYQFYVPNDDKGEEHVLLVEKWENRDYQQAHLKLEAFRRMQTFSGDYVVRGKLEAFTTQD